jgi:hypothetical protein
MRKENFAVRLNEYDDPPAMPDFNEVRDQLKRILRSAPFRDSPQLMRFLTFVVEASLANKADSLKAYTIAVGALGRGSDFDPQTDPIVRVEAGRLRDALMRYYAKEGRADRLVIDLPRGTYVPNFRRPSIAPPPAATSRPIEDFILENQRTRVLIASLAVTLRQAVGLARSAEHPGAKSAHAANLLQEAEEYFRCAKELDAAGHELMALAVKIETKLQRERRNRAHRGNEFPE